MLATVEQKKKLKEETRRQTRSSREKRFIDVEGINVFCINCMYVGECTLMYMYMFLLHSTFSLKPKSENEIRYDTDNILNRFILFA